MPREPSWWYRPAGLTATALGPVSRLYGAVAEHRFARGENYRSPLPVICVGNFTAGGSGKTPFTAMLAEVLLARGERPVILTRGYGGRTAGPHWVDAQADTAAGVGDEPLLLAKIAPVLVARDRAAGARAIEERAAATVIVMDDGLQNAALEKDLAIAVVDGSRGLGNGCVIPAGPLRAPMAAQGARVGLIAFNGVPAPDLLAQMEQQCRAPCIKGQLQSAGDVGWLKGARVLAYAGIGHPGRFFETLRSLGAIVVEERSFGDHATMSRLDAASLLARAATLGATLITTQKDHIRLNASPQLMALVAASQTLRVCMVLLPNSDKELDQILTHVFEKKRY